MRRLVLTILGIFGFAIFFIGIVYVGWVVHCILDRICVRHARRFCRRHGFEISRVRWQMEFERRPDGRRGVKTEYTLVQLDCFDKQKPPGWFCCEFGRLEFASCSATRFIQ